MTNKRKLYISFPKSTQMFNLGLWQKLEELELVKPDPQRFLPRDPHLSFVDSGIGRFIHSPQRVSAVLFSRDGLGGYEPCTNARRIGLSKHQLYDLYKIPLIRSAKTWPSWSPDLQKAALKPHRPFFFYWRKIKEMEVTNFQESRNENERLIYTVILKS